MPSTVTPSSLKYPFCCATKYGACVPWMIQSRMIRTFFTSAWPGVADRGNSQARLAAAIRATNQNLLARDQRPIIIVSPTGRGLQLGRKGRGLLASAIDQIIATDGNSGTRHVWGDAINR